MHKRWWYSLMALCAFVLLPNGADAQRVEVRAFNSEKVTSQQFLTGARGQPVTIAGVLRIPEGAIGRVGAVVLMHGSGGIVPATERWVEEFARMGLATFLVDSFSGRGVIRTVGDQSQVDSLAMLLDAYRALAVLAEDPRIDPAQIAVVGWSKGALAALYSSSQRFTSMYAPRGVRFAAHVAVYAPCYYRYRDDHHLTGSPVRLFHGDADAITPVDACRELVARLKSAGGDVGLTVFAGAGHGYDRLAVNPTTLLLAQTVGACRVDEGDLGVLINRTTGRLFTLTDACVTRLETSLVADPLATTETMAGVRRVLAAALR